MLTQAADVLETIGTLPLSTIALALTLQASSNGPSAGKTRALLWSAACRIAREQKTTAALVFAFKALRGPRPIAAWIDYIDRHHMQYDAPPPNTRVLRKPQRNYGIVGRSVAQRACALVAHYDFAAARLRPTAIRDLLNQVPIRIALLEARGQHFELWLGSSLPFGQKQEGELTLWLADEAGRPLARAAFSFGRDELAGSYFILIGGLQGLSAGADKKIIVAATRAMSGLRPKEAVLVGLQALAGSLLIEDLRSASMATHVLAAEWMKENAILRDYDGFWRERHGSALPGIGFQLPVPDFETIAKSKTSPRLLDLHRASLARQTKLLINETCDEVCFDEPCG